MPNFNNWLGNSAASRAEDAWRRINDKPSSVTLIRENSTLEAQTVRIEASETVREIEGGSGISSKRDVIVFGIQDHATLADTDIQRGDLFRYNGSQYRVLDVVSTIGEIQARCEVSK